MASRWYSLYCVRACVGVCVLAVRYIASLTFYIVVVDIWFILVEYSFILIEYSFHGTTFARFFVS